MRHSLLNYWHLDGMIAIFLAGICLSYFYLTEFKIIKRSVFFFAGIALIILSTASPLYFLGENYLMSAHMLVHVILLLIAAPLLVMGIPEHNNNKFLVSISEIISSVPWLPWILGVSIMWFWHIPFIFNHLFESHGQIDKTSGVGYSLVILKDFHLMSLVIAGIFFSLPVIGPNSSSRLSPLNAVLYLSAACIFCSILGLLITFAPTGIYTGYINIDDRFGFLDMIRNQHGISVIVDQQMAGLIMWVPGCLIYLSVSIFLLMKWFREKKADPLVNSNNMSHE